MTNGVAKGNPNQTTKGNKNTGKQHRDKTSKNTLASSTRQIHNQTSDGTKAASDKPTEQTTQGIKRESRTQAKSTVTKQV